MLPALLWLFITPGKCGLCYFLIRLVLGAEGPAPGMAWRGTPDCSPSSPSREGPSTALRSRPLRTSGHLREGGRWGCKGPAGETRRGPLPHCTGNTHTLGLPKVGPRQEGDGP